jgi:hypothetical protein
VDGPRPGLASRARDDRQMSTNQPLSSMATRAQNRPQRAPDRVQSAAVTHLPPLTEREFQAQVLDLARICGWSVYHPALSKWSERGWPDLALCRPPRLVFAELKRENGKPSMDQRRWLAMLGGCPGVETYLWRPSDLFDIARTLR